MKTRELYLDFIRGIAILLAMGWHFNNTDTGIRLLDYLLIPGRVLGWAGVDLFFVLSGFLIGGLIFNEYKKTGGFRVGRFLIRRAFKIWPILYVYLMLLIISGRYPWESFLLQNLFHVQNYFLTPLAHLWSLAVEEHFYLLFSFCLLILTRSKAKSMRVFLVIIPLVMLTCLLLRFAAYSYPVDLDKIYIQTQYRIDALAFGVGLAYIKTFDQDKFETLAKNKIILAAILFLGITILALFQEDIYFKVTIRYTITYVTAGVMLLYFYRLKFVSERNFVVKGIAWIGVYSYAMYVYQFVVMRVVEALLKKLQITDLPVVTDLVIKYGGAIMLAVVLTKLIERPFLSLRERMFPSYAGS
ncbi:acyltransferase [Methylomonas sp. OY6]|uniref:Acyltransferase n=1 Tax=Methylomonas defluvii TaxID=3045149 RepID=A0ABU4UEI3_9GAMM|nr:acyltransferase [Methylomonas sp. OY6]MDX8127154.1 acyltransferase [Methylomonas sp. OY6]